MAYSHTTANWQDPQHFEEAIQGIKEQEQALQFQTFDFEVARKIGEKIQAEIKALHDDSKGPNSATALISIRLWSGLTLVQNTYGSGVTVSNEDWARRKANTVRTYGKSSFLIGRELVKKGRDINSLGADYAAHGGAFPINIKGVNTGPIGTIIVSGLEQWQDHHVIVEALRSLL